MYCPSSSSSQTLLRIARLQNSHFFLVPKYLKNLRKPSKFVVYYSPPTPKGSSFRKGNLKIFSCSATDSVEEESYHARRKEDAQKTIRVYLEEIGASSEDASHISSLCPNYLNSLIDAVDDLDDWNSWAAVDNSQEAISFEKKVYKMAKRRGDKGILPFLESLGLSLSSATHMAHYLSASLTLPRLIYRVNYLKKSLFSGIDDTGLLGKTSLRMMANLSVSVDEDVQQTLAFFEKIQARRGGLNLLGSEQPCLRFLIESFPRILFVPIESRIPVITTFFESIGVPQGCSRNILLLFPPILCCDVENEIKPRLQSYAKVGAKDQDLGKMLVKYPWILSTAVLDNFEKFVKFFEGEKVAEISFSSAIKKWPLILGSSVEKASLLVHQFLEMGVNHKKLGQIIATSPQLLLRKPQDIVEVASFFEDLGMDKEAMARTLTRCPEIFTVSIDKTLTKKLEFLSVVGITKTHLPRIIRKYPELFVCDVDKALLPRMKYLESSGLSKKDIRSMVSRFSPLLGYSIKEVLQPKLEFLVNIMGFPLNEVVDYPRYFSYSLDKKIKPRYWVLKSRNVEFKLRDMLGKNDEEFAAEYLCPP